MTCLAASLALCLGASLLTSPKHAWARPPLVTVEKVEGDATVTLILEDEFIKDDALIPCQVTVEISGSNKAFTEGDTIELRILEDDVPLTDIGDDVLWEIEEVADSEVVSAQRFSRTYDCSFSAVEDFLGGLEVYAQLKVDKQECGNLCEVSLGEDTPSTSNVSMGEMVDDGSEEDDNSAEAFLLPRRGVTDRIARDTDWLKVRYDYPVELLARLETNFAGGDLDLTLYDSELAVIAEAVMEEGGAAKRLAPASAILPGDYFLEVSLPEPENFNFYDLIITESQITTDCAPGAVEERPCMRCGVERKTCSDEGEWGEWGGCEDSGVCDPGAEESQGCGEGGSQSRVCGMDCQWEDFSSCVQCEDGETESCYSGPAMSAGVGACVEGTRSCSRGQWSSCQGDVRPNIENCFDGIDNDCDGLTDRSDPECVAGLGDACTPGDCESTFECLPPPFADGYCGGTDCTQCGVGSICGNAFGAEYCLKPCASFTDCRFGYICAPAGSMGEQVCVPPCESDESCGQGFTCNDQQVCAAVGGGSTPTSPGAKAPAEEGCAQQSQSAQYLWIFTLLIALGTRRRDSAQA